MKLNNILLFKEIYIFQNFNAVQPAQQSKRANESKLVGRMNKQKSQYFMRQTYKSKIC